MKARQERIALQSLVFLYHSGQLRFSTLEYTVDYCSEFSRPALITELAPFPENRTLPQNHRQKVCENGTLVIADVERRTDDGQYTCVVTGEHNVVVSKQLKLTVMSEYGAILQRTCPFLFVRELLPSEVVFEPV